jgi:hypothetical protein
VVGAAPRLVDLLTRDPRACDGTAAPRLGRRVGGEMPPAATTRH